MLRLRKVLFIAASISILVTTCFVLERALDPDRVCLEWGGLHELTVGDAHVPSCETVGRLHRPKLSGQVRDFVRRLNRLSRLDWLTNSNASIAVKIDDQNPQAYAQTGGWVTVGRALAEKPGHLERAALQTWIQRNWPEHGELTQEVMTDIFLWATVGDAWTDPTDGHEVNVSDRLRFSLIPDSPASYCQFPFRSDRAIEDCESSVSEDWDRHVALQPLVSWTIWNYIRELPSSQQVKFFRESIGQHFPTLTESAEADAQAWVQVQVKALLQQWQMPTTNSDLRRVFYRADLMEPVRFDLTVEVTDASQVDRTLESLKHWMRFSPRKRVLFVSAGQNRILPEDIRVDLQPNNIQTRRYAIIACEWPKPQDVLHLKSQLLYAIRVCSDNKLPVWHDLMTSQAQTHFTAWTQIAVR